MNTLENILKEIKDVPDNRLKELYQFVQSLTPKSKIVESKSDKILSYEHSVICKTLIMKNLSIKPK